ncbi:MAG TPA: hypothetical protein VHW02_08960 [Rhizomicrobium sp.]|jgi:hypothetical protein|nr:hypothetical protein [Rhizomicrobium sp.]
MRHIFLPVLLTAALVGGCAIAAGNPGAFAGDWTITAAKTAPWADPAHPLADNGERASLLNSTVVISANKITGLKQVACPDPHYDIKTYAPDMLFQGGLQHPATDAPALGFKGNAVKVLETDCENEVDWHMADNGTLEFGLNDYVYVLTKKTK